MRGVKGAKKRMVWRAVAVLIAAAVLALLGTWLYICTSFETKVDLSLFGADQPDSTTRFYYCDTGIDHCYDENRVVELEETLKGNRIVLHSEYGQMPKALINAFVAIEDKRFFDHHGVDLYRSVAAAANYVLGFDTRFGASTITQQLIKNVTGDDQITISRKIQEILYAYDLENKMSKEEILEQYLNVINLAEGCYGVGAAADIYFSKSVEELDPLECVAIAAITNSPTYYDPIRNPDNNKDRRNLILRVMLEQGYLSEPEFEELYDRELQLNVNQKALRERVNSWYVDMVVEDVIDALSAQYGYSRQVASHMVYNGGLRIITAMDKRVQEVVTQYYENVRHFSPSGEIAQSSMIVIHPRSGDVLAVAGAVGEKKGNRLQSYATDAKRPSGSTVKPLSVYAPGLEDGRFTYASVYDDVPVKFIQTAKGYSTWPNNANMVYRGLTNVNYALANSLNTVAVKALADVGTERAFSFLRDTLHIESLIEKEALPSGGYLTDKAPAALALGQMNHGVTLREMTAAYSIFSNQGQYSKPRSFYKVYDAWGRELLSNEREQTYAISSANASVMTKMLEHVISTGTAKPITLDNWIDVAGKTGTTQNNHDKWFIAYTPYCLCGVWYGYEYPKSVEGSEKNQYLKVWNDVMTELHKSYYIPTGGVRHFKLDKDVVKVTFCRDSGKRMGTDCYLDPRNNRAEVGYFVRGTEPRDFCNCHFSVEYDAECGGVVCEGCRCENKTRVGLIRVDRHFPVQICVTDAQYVGKTLPIGMTPVAEEGRPYFAGILGARDFCGVSMGAHQYNQACLEHYGHGEASEVEETANDPEQE